MNLSGIYQSLKDIDQHPEILTQSQGKDIESKEIEEFMCEWFLYYENEYQKNQFSYFWKLVHGWSLQQLRNQQIQTSLNVEDKRQIQYQREPTQILSSFSLERGNELGNNFIQYVSKSEAIVKQQESLIWINPSKIVEQIDLKVIIVLTSANIHNIVTYLKIKALSPVKTKLITTESIYKKIQMLSVFLSKININVDAKQCYMLKPDEYYEYNQIIWLMRENSWYEPIYDLTLTFIDSKNTKRIFLIQNCKLGETKLIYYGWKKKYITEIRYQAFVRQWEKQVILPEQNMYMFPIQAKIIRQKDKSDWYLSFCQKEMIKQLQDEEKKQLFSCCELFKYIPNQTIVKKGYLFDYVYILLEGDFQISESNGQFYKSGKITIQQIFGIQELKRDQNNYLFTLYTLQKATIFRIAKHNLKFILYDFLC